MAKTNKTRYAALGMLTIQPMSGYEMKKIMAQTTEYFWSESNGQLYPALARLAKEGLVTFKTEMVGAKQKKIYDITTNGREALEIWLAEDVEIYPERNELLLKVFFGHNAPLEVTLQHIQERERISKKALKLYQKIDDEFKQQRNDISPQRYGFAYSTLRYGIKSCELELEWCQETMKLLQSDQGEL